MLRKSQQWDVTNNSWLLDENAAESTPIDYSKSFYAPYHPKAVRMLRKLKKDFNVNCVFKKTTTLGNHFFKRRPQPDIWNTSHVCYQIPCGDCPKKYIGHTKRKLRTRVGEHKKTCEGDLSGITPNLTNDNGVPYHCATTGHNFNFEETCILAQEKSYFRRIALEGMLIHANKDSLANLKSGFSINNCWVPFYSDLGLTHTE